MVNNWSDLGRRRTDRWDKAYKWRWMNFVSIVLVDRERPHKWEINLEFE